MRKTPLLALLAPLALALLQAPAALSAESKGPPSFQVPAGWSAADATVAQKAAVARMRSLLETDLTLEVVVTGHTDSIGLPDENLAIGYFYAERVARELPALGLPAGRLRIATAGETSPAKPGGGFFAQEGNRRVTVTMMAAEVTPLSSQARSAGGKKVFITEPSPGRTDRAYQKVRAIVEGGARTALLTINGVSQIIPVSNSRVESEAVLDRGSNAIEVTAWDETGASGKDRVELEYLPPPPQVAIDTPRDGQEFDTTESPVIRVSGKVASAAPLAEAFLFLNGAPRRIQVDKDGAFSQPIVLIQEQNALRVEAVDVFGKVATSEDVKIRSITLAPKDLVVFLTWDKDGIDVDLHAFGPGNTHTWYGGLDPFDAPDAIPGGALDIDNKLGFGPEVFTLVGENKGTYSFEARYHHSLTSEPCQAQVTVVLHPAEPSRRVVRVFGPRTLSPGTGGSWGVVRISMPEGIFDER